MKLRNKLAMPHQRPFQERHHTGSSVTESRSVTTNPATEPSREATSPSLGKVTGIRDR